MARGLEEVAALPDPVGRVLATFTRPNGLVIERVATPLGVVGVIYESRPNVTADAGALCLKSGNAVVLRGGSDSFHSSAAIHACLAEGLEEAGLPEAAVSRAPFVSRAAVGEMLEGLGGALDVIVPRGGKSLVDRVQREARVPVFAHLEGIVHVYVDRAADLDKAIRIVVNAKMRRTGICGAAETLLVHRRVADCMLGPLIEALSQAGCEVRGDPFVREADRRVKAATEEDWRTEYLDAIIAVRVVDSLEAAIDHIETYGSHHTDCIVTEDQTAAEKFLKEVELGDRHPQRLDPVRGRGRVRLRGRNRHRHRADACARAGRGRAALHLQVPRARRRPNPGLRLAALSGHSSAVLASAPRVFKGLDPPLASALKSPLRPRRPGENAAAPLAVRPAEIYLCARHILDMSLKTVRHQVFHRHFEAYSRHGRHGGFGHGRFGAGRGGGFGAREGRMFDGGELRLVILALIAEKPRHGYDIIKEIGERVGGDYSPSPGVVYPTLTMLEDMGYARPNEDEQGRKLYAVTPEGENALADNKAQVDAIFARFDDGQAESGRAGIASVIRAMLNLRAATRLRLRSRPATQEQIQAIVDALDAAAKSVERA